MGYSNPNFIKDFSFFFITNKFEFSGGFLLLILLVQYIYNNGPVLVHTFVANSMEIDQVVFSLVL